jgi:hypothetical protein
MFAARNMIFTGEFSPLSLAPALWLSDTGTNPAQWDDLSGNGRHATQATPASQPAIVTGALNGRQVRRFDGSDDIMRIDIRATFPQPVTLFTVTKKSANPAAFNSRVLHASSSFSTEANLFLPIACNGVSPNVGNFLMNFGAGDQTGINFGGDYQILTTLANAAGSEIRRNGAQIYTGNPGSNGLQRYASIGGRSSDGLRNYNGDIAEILIYTALSTADRQKVELYLSQKYAIPLA